MNDRDRTNGGERILSCTDVEQHVSLYVGRDLEASLQGEVERHLTTCAACREHATAARAARAALQERLRATPVLGRELWPDVRAALAREGLLAPHALPHDVSHGVAQAAAHAAAKGAGPHAAATIAIAPLKRRPHVLRWLTSAAAAAAAILFGIWLGSSKEDPSDATPPIAEVGTNPSSTLPSNGLPSNGLDEQGSARAEEGHVADAAMGLPTQVPLVPVSNDGLRRLQPGEARFGTHAKYFIEEPPQLDAWRGSSRNVGTPVGGLHPVWPPAR